MVCNPIGNTGGTTGLPSNAGLVATLSYFPFQVNPQTGQEDNTLGGGINLADFSSLATVLSTQVFFTQVDVPSETFTAGFAGPNGAPLTNANGTVLDQYFGLDFHSQIVLGNDTPGNYQFLTLSDDGSILSLDTGNGLKPFISDDGEHASEVQCSSSTVAMTSTSQIPMELQYFQGPPVSIAMIVMWRLVPPGGSLSDPACGIAGGDNYYFNETTLQPLGPYLDLLSRGWQVLAPDNYILPATSSGGTGTNPCVTAPSS